MKNITKTLSAVGGNLALLAMQTSHVFAQLRNPVIEGALGNDDDAAKSGTSFTTYFISIWNAVIAIGAIFVLVYFVWGAVEWIASGGDKGKIESARNRITQAVVGLIILVGSYAIIGFIGQIFFGDDFNILRLNFPNALEGR